MICSTQALETHDCEPSVIVRDLTFAFGRGEWSVPVLKNVDLTLHRGEVVILVGPSGSGKTTLLTLIGCLRSMQAGQIDLLGTPLSGAFIDTLTRMRRRMGFIFQAHNLHKSLTALENVRMGLEVQGAAALRNWQDDCSHMLEILGLGERRHFLPEKLSGGQKQRVAVARALVGNPDLVLADEPTAALDKDSGRQVVELLRDLADERHATVLMVTHDHRIMDVADRIVRMEDGQVAEDLPLAEATSVNSFA